MVVAAPGQSRTAERTSHFSATTARLRSLSTSTAQFTARHGIEIAWLASVKPSHLIIQPRTSPHRHNRTFRCTFILSFLLLLISSGVISSFSLRFYSTYEKSNQTSPIDRWCHLPCSAAPCIQRDFLTVSFHRTIYLTESSTNAYNSYPDTTDSAVFAYGTYHP